MITLRLSRLLRYLAYWRCIFLHGFVRYPLAYSDGRLYGFCNRCDKFRYNG